LEKKKKGFFLHGCFPPRRPNSRAKPTHICLPSSCRCHTGPVRQSGPPVIDRCLCTGPSDRGFFPQIFPSAHATDVCHRDPGHCADPSPSRSCHSAARMCACHHERSCPPSCSRLVALRLRSAAPSLHRRNVGAKRSAMISLMQHASLTLLPLRVCVVYVTA
jgi:hypothetical protein